MDSQGGLITRRAALASGLVGVAAAAAGCGTSSGSGSAAPQAAKVTQATAIVYWTNLGGADGSRMKELTEQYQNETPLVTIDQIQGVAPYFDKVLASVDAHDLRAVPRRARRHRGL